jgi:hypothetical protein
MFCFYPSGFKAATFLYSVFLQSPTQARRYLTLRHPYFVDEIIAVMNNLKVMNPVYLTHSTKALLIITGSFVNIGRSSCRAVPAISLS